MHYKRFAVATILFLNIHQQLLAMNKSTKQNIGYKNPGPNFKSSQYTQKKFNHYLNTVNRKNATREQKLAKIQDQVVTPLEQQFVAALIAQQMMPRTNNMSQ